MSSNGCPHPLRNFVDVQAPHFEIIVTVGSYCDSILAAQMCRYIGAFFVARRRASQSNRCCSVESSVAILYLHVI